MGLQNASRIAGIARRTKGGTGLNRLGVFLKFAAIVMAVIAIGTGSTAWREGEIRNMRALAGGLMFLVIAQTLYSAGSRVRKAGLERDRDKLRYDLLHYIDAQEGSVTVLDVAKDMAVPIDQAEDLLRELVSRGHAELKVSDSGMTVYHVREFSRDDDRYDAQSIDSL